MSFVFRLSLALTVCLLPGWSHALTLRPASVDQLVNRAEVVFVGEVEAMMPRPWNKKPGATWSDYHVNVLMTLKGKAGDQLIVGLPGGSRNGLSTLVFGAPRLTVGQRAVFMLERLGNEWVPLNYGQGVWPEELATVLSETRTGIGTSLSSANGYAIMMTTADAEVHWKNRCVEIWTQDLGSEVFDQAAIQQVLDESFARWEDAQGGDLQGIDRGYTCFDEVGFDDWPGPQNVIHFREEQGSWIHPSQIAGLTTIMYREHNGEIVDADIEFNLVNERFTVDGSVDSFSLRYTMTHELGHLLGLDHSSINASVMAVNSVPKNVGDFALHSDDKNAVIANYPAGEGEVTCGSTTYFPADESYCPPPPPSSGCAASGERSRWEWLLGFLLVVGALRRRVGGQYDRA